MTLINPCAKLYINNPLLFKKQCLSFMYCILRNEQTLNYFIFFILKGAVPKGNATQENIKRLNLADGQVVFKCPKCVSIKPDRAHHCR